LKDRLKGVIINRVPEDMDADTLNNMITTLIDKGIPVTSILREDPVLSYSNLRQIKNILDGELLCCEEEIDRLVGGMTVGSAYLKGELAIFKRAYNKIILLRPSNHTNGTGNTILKNISGILLTGSVYPASQLVSAAEKTNVPLIVIKKDTFSALELLEKKSSILSPEDIFKVERLTELMDKDNTFDRLFKNLGISG
jgi:BioD-like phosphotransacetylase family protein